MDWESLYCPHRRCRYYGRPFSQGHMVTRLLLDSRGVDVPRSSKAILVTPLAWNAFFFHGLKNELRFSDAGGVEDPGIQYERRPAGWSLL